MSRLDELIQKYCPDGVEYKTLGEIATDIFRGSGITRDQVHETGTPCVRYGEIYTTYGIWFEKCVSSADEELLTSKKYFGHGDILFAITGESVEDIAKCCAYIGHDNCLAGGDIVVLKHNEDPKYMAYALSTVDAQKQKSKGKVKSKVVHSSVPDIKAISIPVPPLSVQREIVKILDNFTELTAELRVELTAELAARKKQYEYYRDQMLTFPKSDATEYQLAEIADFSYGYTDKASDHGDTRFIRITDITPDGHLQTADAKYITLNSNNKKYLLQKGDLVMARTGATFGKTLYFEDDEQAVYASFLIKIMPNPEILTNRYYWHYSQSSLYWDQANNLVSTGGQPQFNANALGRVKIKVPSIAIQNKITDVLDNFDAICSDLKIGLPAEIKARKKQYKFYRDQLLTFAEGGRTISRITLFLN